MIILGSEIKIQLDPFLEIVTQRYISITRETIFQAERVRRSIDSL